MTNDEILALHQAGGSAGAIAKLSNGERSRCAVLGVIKRHRDRTQSTQAKATFVTAEGQSTVDPNRADRLLRRFSWETA